MNTAPTVSRVIRLDSGRHQGPVTRVFSPGDVGQVTKPFIFLDRFDIEGTGRPLFAMHPHSGIATLTVLTSGRMRYEDTTGKAGVLDAGSVEWMRAGAGVWHDGWPEVGDRVQGWQLWLALPVHLEGSPAESMYLPAATVPIVGPARVILGELDGAVSLVDAPPEVDVYHVRLDAGQRWTHVPRPSQTVCWLHVAHGALQAEGVEVREQLAVVHRNERPLVIEASAGQPVEFIVGLAPQHPFDLVMGRHSVHTSALQLARGKQEIARIGEQLRSQARMV